MVLAMERSRIENVGEIGIRGPRAYSPGCRRVILDVPDRSQRRQCPVRLALRNVDPRVAHRFLQPANRRVPAQIQSIKVALAGLDLRLGRRRSSLGAARAEAVALAAPPPHIRQPIATLAMPSSGARPRNRVVIEGLRRSANMRIKNNHYNFLPTLLAIQWPYALLRAIIDGFKICPRRGGIDGHVHHADGIAQLPQPALRGRRMRWVSDTCRNAGKWLQEHVSKSPMT